MEVKIYTHEAVEFIQHRCVNVQSQSFDLKGWEGEDLEIKSKLSLLSKGLWK